MPSKKGITIGKIRTALYKSVRLLGDVNSVKRGTINRRITNRVIGKVSGRISSKLSRNFLNLFK